VSARPRRTAKSAPKAAPAASKPDGRHARTARTRAAIVDAVLALVTAGDPAPTAAAIARRAKVSVRSIAAHFPSRAALFAAASSSYHARPATPEPASPGAGAVTDRLATLLAARAVELEQSRPVRASAARFAAQFEVVAAAVAESAERRRGVVARVFAAETARDHDLLDLLDLVLGGRVWDALRERGIAPARARVLVERLAAAVLM
jgi:TetR/AcrR family transcriptional regulator of autoinduction and epiphytic fitness